MFKYLMIILVAVFGYGVKTIYDLKFEVNGLKVQNANLVTKNRTNKKIIKKHRKALKTKNMARIKNKIDSVPAKSIPLLGTVVIASATASDIYDLCQDIKAFEELEQSMFGPMGADETQSEDEICGFDLNETVDAIVASVSK